MANPENRLRTPPSDKFYLERYRSMSKAIKQESGPGEQCRNRIIEWGGALMLLNFGLTSFLSPATLAVGSFKYMTALGITAAIFAYSNTVVGVIRMLALYFNGYGLPWTARVRALCAIFGAGVFGIMGLSLLYLTKDTLTLSLGAGTHFILAGLELYSCLRAGADVAEKSRRDALQFAVDTMHGYFPYPLAADAGADSIPDPNSSASDA